MVNAVNSKKINYRLDLWFDYLEPGVLNYKLWHDAFGPYEELMENNGIHSLETENRFVIYIKGINLPGDKDADLPKKAELSLDFVPEDGGPDPLDPIDLKGIEVKDLFDQDWERVKPKRNKDGEVKPDSWDIPKNPSASLYYHRYKLQGNLSLGDKEFSFDPIVKVGPYR
jgi:hypothetical protein